MSENYQQILRPCRSRKRESSSSRSPIEEFYNDRTRIIYSSSFRRLQQKAQVFSLEPNSSVRTRLTHSIEVSDIGRILAQKIAEGLRKQNIIKDDALIPQIVAVVENACLLHDIGNPPFGHFGESAIRKWMSAHLKDCIDSAGVGYEALKTYITDFTQFDGNPQGFRTITRLHCERDDNGLNLSYPTLLTGIKYKCFPDEINKDDALTKKAGYFYSEKDLVNRIYNEIYPKGEGNSEYQLNERQRYPLAYIMEAADDIAYSLSDISDGIEKRIITEQSFLEKFEQMWEQAYREPIPAFWDTSDKDEFGDKAAYWSSHLIDEATSYFLSNHEKFFNGEMDELISKNSVSGKFLKTLRSVSRKYLYRSSDAENIELSGYSIITGLLDSFGELLKMPHEKFVYLADDEKSPEGKGIDYEWRLFNRLSKSSKKNYRNQLKQEDQMGLKIKSYDYEWWLRVHMVLDHIAGMTDEYALAVYQMLKGISISANNVK